MRLFRHEARQRSAESRRLYARYELAHTMADFAAAVCFLVGSVMFFREAWQYTGTWLFVVGSLLFALKPTLRLGREIRLYRMGDFSDLSDRAE
ncbi:YrhK family protein [Oceaniglobus trochenteri]|uniref:YrhK family protein n=1 Tax=Oceaniglobus trochenteri TaxID=2763260 RepID=UPI001CFF637D|nr:YrhK family protein [Oceaniglobus trochenteri]